MIDPEDLEYLAKIGRFLRDLDDALRCRLAALGVAPEDAEKALRSAREAHASLLVAVAAELGVGDYLHAPSEKVTACGDLARALIRKNAASRDGN